MKWTEADCWKLTKQFVELLGTSGHDDAFPDRLVDLIEDTLTIYGVPFDELAVCVQLHAMVNFLEVPSVRTAVEQAGSGRKEFLVCSLGRWVGNTINFQIESDFKQDVP
jgi:hypothetical protein